jgi:protein TonB
MARDALRSHLSGSVPISIAAHLVVLLLLLIMPLAADVALPPPASGMPEFVRIAAVPPPPAFVPASPRLTPSRISNTSAPPTSPPDAIHPEVERSVPQIDGAVGPPGGLPPGLGEFGGVAPPTVPPPLPDPPKPPATVRVAMLPEAPRKIADARPIYPEIARAAHVEGTVVLEAVLDPTGRVTQLRVIKSVPLLDQAALDAVGRWRYTPSLYGGRPVSVLMTITIRFTLER